MPGVGKSKATQQQNMMSKLDRRCIMRKTLVTTIAAITTAALLTMSTAHAATYKFTFQSSDAGLTATGEFTVDSAEQVTNMSGAISGLTNQTISAGTANSSFPTASYSPDGSFIYNDVYHPTGMAFDINGVLFTTAQNPGGYWNLWGVRPAITRSMSPPAVIITRSRRSELSASWPPPSRQPGRCWFWALRRSALLASAASARRAWRPASAKSRIL
jgi:hypothetical protein